MKTYQITVPRYSLNSVSAAMQRLYGAPRVRVSDANDPGYYRVIVKTDAQKEDVQHECSRYTNYFVVQEIKDPVNEPAAQPKWTGTLYEVALSLIAGEWLSTINDESLSSWKTVKPNTLLFNDCMAVLKTGSVMQTTIKNLGVTTINPWIVPAVIIDALVNNASKDTGPVEITMDNLLEIEGAIGRFTLFSAGLYAKKYNEDPVEAERKCRAEGVETVLLQPAPSIISVLKPSGVIRLRVRQVVRVDGSLYEIMPKSPANSAHYPLRRIEHMQELEEPTYGDIAGASGQESDEPKEYAVKLKRVVHGLQGRPGDYIVMDQDRNLSVTLLLSSALCTKKRAQAIASVLRCVDPDCFVVDKHKAQVQVPTKKWTAEVTFSSGPGKVPAKKSKRRTRKSK